MVAKVRSERREKPFAIKTAVCGSIFGMGVENACTATVFQADDEGSIPFTRSKFFNKRLVTFRQNDPDMFPCGVILRPLLASPSRSSRRSSTAGAAGWRGEAGIYMRMSPISISSSLIACPSPEAAARASSSPSVSSSVLPCRLAISSICASNRALDGWSEV